MVAHSLTSCISHVKRLSPEKQPIMTKGFIAPMVLIWKLLKWKSCLFISCRKPNLAPCGPTANHDFRSLHSWLSLTGTLDKHWVYFGGKPWTQSTGRTSVHLYQFLSVFQNENKHLFNNVLITPALQRKLTDQKFDAAHPAYYCADLILPPGAKWKIERLEKKRIRYVEAIIN